MSSSANVASTGMRSRRPLASESTTQTSSPRARRASATWDPMNPAPPVTIVLMAEEDNREPPPSGGSGGGPRAALPRAPDPHRPFARGKEGGPPLPPAVAGGQRGPPAPP